MESFNQANLDEAKEIWKSLINCTLMIIEKSKEKSKCDQVSNLAIQTFKQAFQIHSENHYFPNNIQINVLMNSSEFSSDAREKHKLKNLISRSFLESVIRILLRLSQNEPEKVNLLYFKDLFTDIFTHFRLNDGTSYHYLLDQLFALLIDLNKVHNDYLRHRDASYFLNDIKQFNQYTKKIEKMNLDGFLIKEIEVPITDLAIIRAHYINLLKILTDIIEPINDISSHWGSKVCQLIELFQDCNTKSMDEALINFVIKCFFVFDPRGPCFQKYFQFVCSVTDRRSHINFPSSDLLLLDKLWNSFFNSLDYMSEENKSVQLMFYLVENCINLHKCKNNHYMLHILPSIFFNVFNKHFDDQRHKMGFHRLLTRVLDFYSATICESYFQSYEWCELVKCLLVKDYQTSPQIENLINYSYMFKFWEFIDQNADNFLFQSSNLLIKFINYTNNLLPCFYLIEAESENTPAFLNFELTNQLVNILLDEFKTPHPSIEKLGDELIEHIYLIVSKFVKLANRYEHELSDEQMAIFYLPWHERKLKFVKEQNQALNTLSRRSFCKSDQILKICLNTIADFPTLARHQDQIDFFDFILRNEYSELKEVLKPNIFTAYMVIANQFSQSKFTDWVNFIIDTQDKKLISSILGNISCMLFRNCGMIYSVDQSRIEFENELHCNQCEEMFESPDIEPLGDLNVLIEKVRRQFNNYLNLQDLENFNILINKSSSKFFNHIDIDEQLIQNVLNLFDVVDPEAKKSFKRLLDNMFNSLKIEKERFYICFKDKFFSERISGLSEKETIAKFENIALMCKYFPKYKLQILIYMLENGILYNHNFIAYTNIILCGVVFKNNENLLDYFLQHKTKICEHMLTRILEQNVKPEVAFSWIKNLISLIIDDESRFLSLFIQAFNVIFPYLIKNRTERSEALLHHILHNLELTNLEDLVIQFIEPLILYFIRNMNTEQIKSAFEYINTLVNLDINEILSKKGNLVYTLLYEYSRQEKAINYLLSILNSEEYKNEDRKHKKPYVDFNQNPEELSLYLAENMGGYLLNLNSQFIRPCDINTKTTLLKSLDRIIKNVSKKTISNYFEKLIAILRSAFQSQSSENEDYQNYIHFIYTVWDTLISNCETSDLPKNLSLICKNLLDLLPIDPAGVSKVFQKLIVNNEENLGSSLKELHFIPDNNRLMNSTNMVIRKYMVKMPERDRDIKAFNNFLKLLAKSLQVENPEIKYFHYKKLLQVLNENEKCLQSFCSSGNDLAVQPIISKHITKLINDSKMNDSQLRSVIGECLGEFGAIDPGRLDMSHFNDQEMSIPFFYDLKDNDFAILIINKLVVYFDLISESKFQDCINYALQELLKQYKIMPNSSNEIWTKIQPRCQSICQQLFKSKFLLKEKIHASNHPVYKETQKFSDWIVKLCISLVGIVRDEFAKKVFDSLFPLINHCISLAEYILPFIIVVILIDGKKKNTDFVFEEIDYLIRCCLPKKNRSESTVNLNSEDQENLPNETLCDQEITVLYEARSEQYQCVHALFSLLDFLTNWRKMIKNHLNLRNKVEQKESSDETKIWQSYNAVNDFLSKINKAELSILAASCQSYDRALMYIEEHVLENKDELAKNYDNLLKLYVALDEPYGVEGIIVCRKEVPSLYNSILSHEVNGELQEAISCCEKANKIYPNELSYSKIYLKCLLLLGHENTAKIFATNSIEQQPDYRHDLQPFIVEASWKMGEWDNLEIEFAKQKISEPKFEVGIGNLFISIRKNDHKLFNELIKEYRLNEVNQISVSSSGNRAYARNYPKLIRLHMLNEIEYFYKNFFMNLRSNKDRISQLTKRFTFRTKNVQTSVRLKEPIINLQRVLLNICSSSLNCNYKSELAELWLSSAKLARKSNNFQSAYNFLLEIQTLDQQDALSFSKNLRAKIIIEKAKYHWQKDTLEDKERAVKELSRGIESLSIQMQECNFVELRKCLTYAKLHLLYNNYSEKTLNLDSDKLRDNYSIITSCYNEWEESYYNLGIYYDSLAKMMEQPVEKAEYLDKVIKNLGQSLKFGSKHVYESMPKLLTSWCDLGDFIVTLNGSKSSLKEGQEESNEKVLKKYCELSTLSIKGFLDSIPAYNFYTAISQLTSRVCHPLENISDQVSKIIEMLVKKYPHQTIWLIVSSLLSENKVRNQKFKKMINKPDMDFSLINKYVEFATQLCKVCLYEVKGSSFDLNAKFPNLKRILDNCRVNNFKLLVPFQCFMQVQLPNRNLDQDLPSLELKDNLVYIDGFSDNVILLKSLVKPKKITIRGSDGKTYVMMCKPKDDLRKDNRAMEFNNLVNRHLRKNSETRKRNLSIKTYTVIPLRHDCGLIEWINDLEGYRLTVWGTYKREIDNFQISNDKIKKIYPSKETSVKESLQIFKEKILPHFPPIYHKFFINQFQNPTSWYNARMNYVHSCAVMSIVGYIIGLGDRHGENILIHLKTGTIVHVDFNCIFNKGADLDVPEVVPFRLTHNMINAMGPTGYEGVFRKTCESTLRVMREEREALMSVLTTFVHDPLIEWNKGHHKSTGSTSSRSTRNLGKNDAREGVNKTAVENLDRIKYRLNGLLGLDVKKEDDAKLMNKSAINRSMILNQTINNNKIPISVNYQVSHVIEEATNLERLCKMYVGWNSFL